LAFLNSLSISSDIREWKVESLLLFISSVCYLLGIEYFCSGLKR
jgi:hypothetical protein